MSRRAAGMAIAVGVAGVVVAALFVVQEPARRRVSIGDPWPQPGIMIPELAPGRLLDRGQVEVAGRRDGRILLVIRSKRIISALGPEIHAWTADTAPARIALGIDPRPAPPPKPERRKPGSATRAVER
ncbi:MAG: hypothetical protein RLZZ127_1127 [Planctomycetota bacterium]|jgi:hypothetical protein